MLVSVLHFMCNAVISEPFLYPPYTLSHAGGDFLWLQKVEQNFNWLTYKYLKKSIIYVQSAGTSWTKVMSLDKFFQSGLGWIEDKAVLKEREKSEVNNCKTETSSSALILFDCWWSVEMFSQAKYYGLLILCSTFLSYKWTKQQTPFLLFWLFFDVFP